jgi:ketosteroid isomerase-like protein
MRQENIELVKFLYVAFGKGDVGTILANVSEDIEWRADGPAVIPNAGATRGKEGVVGFFRLIGETQENPQLTISEYCGDGNKVVAVGHYTSRVRATGKPIDTPSAHVFTIEAGKVKRFHAFVDTAQVAEAYTA